MKRELKDRLGKSRYVLIWNRKAHPDEKGTESGFDRSHRQPRIHRKAHPDEKGTESGSSRGRKEKSRPIARPIPMKRELKGFR